MESRQEVIDCGEVGSDSLENLKKKGEIVGNGGEMKKLVVDVMERVSGVYYDGVSLKEGLVLGGGLNSAEDVSFAVDRLIFFDLGDGVKDFIDAKNVNVEWFAIAMAWKEFKGDVGIWAWGCEKGRKGEGFVFLGDWEKVCVENFFSQNFGKDGDIFAEIREMETN